MRRTLLVVALFAVFLAVASPPAAADCSVPTIEIVQREIAPGEEFRVLGSAWGNNCYDTGPPPAGQGALGVPVNRIEIYVVQGDREWLIGIGSADAHYGFTVTVVAPADLAPGDAGVRARRSRGVAYSPNQNFVVIAASASSVIGTTVVSFGSSESTLEASAPTLFESSGGETLTSPTGAVPSPSTVAAETPDEQQSASERSSKTTLLNVVGIAVALVALTAAVSLARSRRD